MSKDGFDPPEQFAGRLVFRAPDRLQHGQNFAYPNFGDRHLEKRRGMLFQAAAPSARLRRFPPGFKSSEVVLRHLAER
jgi:hypothetical protein